MCVAVYAAETRMITALARRMFLCIAMVSLPGNLAVTEMQFEFRLEVRAQSASEVLCLAESRAGRGLWRYLARRIGSLRGVWEKRRGWADKAALGDSIFVRLL